MSCVSQFPPQHPSSSLQRARTPRALPQQMDGVNRESGAAGEREGEAGSWKLFPEKGKDSCVSDCAEKSQLRATLSNQTASNAGYLPSQTEAHGPRDIGCRPNETWGTGLLYLLRPP